MVLKADKTCPECESGDYRFRARKNLVDAVETKYTCAACGHSWMVKVAAAAIAAPASDQALPPLWEVDGRENL